MYFLTFNSQVRFGSVEHFYHFLWGYALPSISEILKIQNNACAVSPARFLFHKCGPVMDNLLHEIGCLFDLDYQIVDREYNDPAIVEILAPRWDIELAKLACAPPMNQNLRFDHWREATALRLAENIDLGHWRALTGERLKSDFMKVKEAFIAKAKIGKRSDSMHSLIDKFLILRRSSQPAFYEPGGKAERPGYGTARRSLIGLNESVQSLQSRNLPISLFEPGSVSLAEQIQAFRCCKGICGIYGAEFANVIWMQPGTVVMWVYKSTTNYIPWMTKQLSQLLNLRFIPIKAADDEAPALPVDSVSSWLLGHPS